MFLQIFVTYREWILVIDSYNCVNETPDPPTSTVLFRGGWLTENLSRTGERLTPDLHVLPRGVPAEGTRDSPRRVGEGRHRIFVSDRRAAPPDLYVLAPRCPSRGTRGSPETSRRGPTPQNTGGRHKDPSLRRGSETEVETCPLRHVLRSGRPVTGGSGHGSRMDQGRRQWDKDYSGGRLQYPNPEGVSLDTPVPSRVSGRVEVCVCADTPQPSGVRSGDGPGDPCSSDRSRVVSGTLPKEQGLPWCQSLRPRPDPVVQGGGPRPSEEDTRRPFVTGHYARETPSWGWRWSVRTRCRGPTRDRGRTGTYPVSGESSWVLGCT